MPGERVVVGLAGPPGAGKTTLALWLVSELGPSAASVPMDGFHLADSVLHRLGRRDRKGAPDTFDPAGYTHLLRRLRDPAGTVYAPAFHREVEESYAGEIEVGPGVRVVVTEGNYLLLDGPWAGVREQLDACWYVTVPEPERVARLVARRVGLGQSPAEAEAWAHGSDQRNAEVVAASRGRADADVSW